MLQEKVLRYYQKQKDNPPPCCLTTNRAVNSKKNFNYKVKLPSILF